jgi:CRISPR-associated protein Cst2
VGEDPNDGISLEPEEKARRVNMVLDVLKVLNRNIKGRMESLNPLFAIGGVYNVKNPFFLGRLKVKYNRETQRYSVDAPIIASVLEMGFNGEKVKDNTYIGLVKGYWENENEIKGLLPENKVLNVNDFFDGLKEKVNEYYGA